MSSLRSALDPVRRSLAHHVGRLKAKVEELRERLRTTTARLLGETVADVVEQIVQRLLTTPTVDLPPVYRPSSYRSQAPPWGRPESLDDPYDSESLYERNYLDESDAEPEPEPEPESETPRASRWRRALALGLRAAAWGLQRWTGRSSIGVALGVGVTATAIVLAGGPLTFAGASLLAWALGLAGLISLAHSGAAVLVAPVIT